MAASGSRPSSRLSLADGLICCRGGPRHGPPHPPTLGRAPAKPWRASRLTQDVSSVFLLRMLTGLPTCGLTVRLYAGRCNRDTVCWLSCHAIACVFQDRTALDGPGTRELLWV